MTTQPDRIHEGTLDPSWPRFDAPFCCGSDMTRDSIDWFRCETCNHGMPTSKCDPAPAELEDEE